MILGFTKHAWGQTQLIYKVRWGIVGFIGENVGKTKRLRYLICFSISWVCFFIMKFQ